jgi:hypothetical protein
LKQKLDGFMPFHYLEFLFTVSVWDINKRRYVIKFKLVCLNNLLLFSFSWLGNLASVGT